MAITKTDFMRGMQCPRMLWLVKHRPSLKVIPPEVQARLDAGNDFGDRAMGMFGPYKEMTVCRPGTNIPDKKAMLAKTEGKKYRRNPASAVHSHTNAGTMRIVTTKGTTEGNHDY